MSVLRTELIWVRMEKCISQKTSDITVTGRYGIPSALNSLWLVLTEPAKMRDMATSLIHLYATGKKDWSTGFESTPTVRTEHAVILLLDATGKELPTLISVKDTLV